MWATSKSNYFILGFVSTVDVSLIGPQHLKPAELEMVTQCKLLISEIARQRHHAGLAVDCVFSAMKILRSAEVFSEKKDKKLDLAR